jgi:hypothetical protein
VGVAVSGDGEVEGTPWFAGRKMREFDAGRKRDKWWRVCKKKIKSNTIYCESINKGTKTEPDSHTVVTHLVAPSRAKDIKPVRK